MNTLLERVAQRAGAAMQPAEASRPRVQGPQSTADLIRAMIPEIKKALPSVMTPERFTRIALSAVKNTPKLAECTPLSFLAAMMNAAQLGLEPNTPLGQAYLIPYKNRGQMEVQFQIGYKGLLDLAFRNERMQSIEAHTVYANDEFYFEYGLSPVLRHVPAWQERGEMLGFYAVFHLNNGGYQFEVMSKADVDDYAAKYSKAFSGEYSPWKTNYEAMALKTVLKRLLKTAPIQPEFRKAMSMDESVKAEIAPDMSEVKNENSDVLIGGGEEASTAA